MTNQHTTDVYARIPWVGHGFGALNSEFSTKSYEMRISGPRRGAPCQLARDLQTLIDYAVGEGPDHPRVLTTRKERGYTGYEEYRVP